MIIPKTKDTSDLELKVSPAPGTGIWELNVKVADKELNATVGRY